MIEKQGVFVLNQNYEPLNICLLKRALVLVFSNKAEVVEYDSVKIRTVNTVYEAPSVIRLFHFVKKPKPKLQLSRQSIFARDGYRCQYCGITTSDLTLDHVIPKRLDGKSTWENLVSACKKCNNRKGDRTLEQAKMKLIKKPKEVKYISNFSFSRKFKELGRESWRKYLSYGTENSSY